MKLPECSIWAICFRPGLQDISITDQNQVVMFPEHPCMLKNRNFQKEEVLPFVK